MDPIKVNPSMKELKKHGNMFKGELYLKEGVYTKYSPNIDDSNVNEYLKKTKSINID
jgi:hypothetical protein